MYDQEEDEIESRSDVRSDEKALMARARDIVTALVAKTTEERVDLPLDELVTRSLEEWDRIPGKAHKARKRLQDRLVREVRHAEMDGLEYALGLGEVARSAKDDAMMALEEWRERLVEEGDGALDAFAQTYPDVDRHRLRQLLRQVAKEGRGGKAFKRVFALLREAVGV